MLTPFIPVTQDDTALVDQLLGKLERPLARVPQLIRVLGCG